MRQFLSRLGMPFRPVLAALLALAAIIGVGLAAAGAVRATNAPRDGTRDDRPTDTLSIAAFSVVREAYGDAILPGFRKFWRERTGRDVSIEISYGASGAESRAVVDGFEADVVVFSMQQDIDLVRRAGLITHDPTATPYRGVVSQSIVAFGVRPGNPKNIHDFIDLTRPDVSVLTANPSTSGGAMWNIAAIYGAAERAASGQAARTPAAAQTFLQQVLARVAIMDKSGRESVQTFERGIGDVVVTYENEIQIGLRAGGRYEQVTPKATLLIENPAALVDVYADKHGARHVAEAFLAYLTSSDAQRALVAYGLRPVNPAVANETANRFAAVGDLFTMKDLGGFAHVRSELFREGGAYARALAGATDVVAHR